MVNSTFKRMFQSHLDPDDRIKMIVDPVQHIAVAPSVSLEVSIQYLFIYYMCVIHVIHMCTCDGA